MGENVKLTVRKSEWLGDWYVIEREHGFRFGDADPEGTGGEMEVVATAIETGKPVSFGRVAVSPTASGGVCLYNPRNSQTTPAINRESALHLAAEIRRVLAIVLVGELVQS